MSTSGRRRAPRVPYPIAGAAMRAAGNRACALGGKLNGRDWRVLNAVLQCTASYSKLEDWVNHRMLHEASGVERRYISTALNKLAALGVIEYKAGRGGRYSTVRLPMPDTGESTRGGETADTGESSRG
jgi:RIO-like serine/threonine protein kinase